MPCGNAKSIPLHVRRISLSGAAVPSADNVTRSTKQHSIYDDQVADITRSLAHAAFGDWNFRFRGWSGPRRCYQHRCGPQVRLTLSGGADLRGMASQCMGGGFGTANTKGSAMRKGLVVSGQALTSVQYSEFPAVCTSSRRATISSKGGMVQQYTPIGSGSMRCITTAELRPGFS
jgi:hypothetical protein